MITIEISGHGKYVVSQDKLSFLLDWLKSNSMPVEVHNPLDPNSQVLID